MAQVTFRIWRGDANGGEFKDYTAEVGEGVVVLDCVHQIQATQAPDLACRWNCKAGKCGSCSAEINGKPRLMCMTRMDTVPQDMPVILQPMKAFPLIKDLVTDVSWNYKVNKMIPPFQPRPPDAPDGTWRMGQEEVDRIQEFRKCIECFLCQDVCHVLREHQKFGEPAAHGEPGANAPGDELFGGPRFMIRVASLEMHPLDTGDRLRLLKDQLNIGFCNITKCCTEVCPEHIHITDNGIIPMKERVVDEFYDPLLRLWRLIFGRRQQPRPGVKELPVVGPR
jgi:succinate dehydrogenase / fumarate reductase iron-sulfur subunit